MVTEAVHNQVDDLLPRGFLIRDTRVEWLHFNDNPCDFDPISASFST